MKTKIKIILGFTLFTFGVIFSGFDNVDAQQSGTTHTCYDTFHIGNTHFNVNCNGCKAQRNDGRLDQSTCTTGSGNGITAIQ